MYFRSEAAAKRFRRNKTSIRNLFGSSRKPKGPTTPVKVVAPETRAGMVDARNAGHTWFLFQTALGN